MKGIIRICGCPIRYLRSIGKARLASLVIVLLILGGWTFLECAFRISLRSVDYSPLFHTPLQREKTEKVVIHHTAIDSDTTSILDIYDYHKHEHKWSTGIAYHYLLMNSTFYKLHSENDVTTHAIGANFNGISICMQGDYSKKSVTLKEYWQCAAMATAIIRKFNLQVSDVYGHSECENNCTECPGANFNMNILRSLMLVQQILI